MARTGRPRGFDKDAVLRAARDLFWKQGYGATSIQDLVDAVGVERASLYAAFGDKRALYLQALALYALDGSAVGEMLSAGPVLPALRRVLLTVLAAAAAQPGRGCMIGNAVAELVPGDEDVTEVARTAYGSLEEVFEDAIRRGQASGELSRRGDPAALAKMLGVFLHGLQLVSRTERAPKRLADAVDAALLTIT